MISHPVHGILLYRHDWTKAGLFGGFRSGSVLSLSLHFGTWSFVEDRMDVLLECLTFQVCWLSPDQIGLFVLAGIPQW